MTDPVPTLTEPEGTPTSHPRGLRVALAAVVVLIVVAALVLATRGDEEPSDLGRAVGAASGVLPSPTLAVTPVTLPPLPIPEALPDNPYEDTPQVVLGTIEIPALGVTADLQRGMSLTAINRGPGWWPGTAMPGELGNVVVAGHRTTYSRPFYRLNELQAGDQVIFTTDTGRYVYEVRGVIVVPETWIDIATQSYAHTATLFACHPPGSATERIVAKLRLLGADGRPVDPDDALPPLDAEAQNSEHTLLVRDRSSVTTSSGTDPLAGSEG
jgi:LPXTG-site transpeptidase (sortase) family protein